MSASPGTRFTVVHLVRHGEVRNPDGVLYGRLPGYHLSDRGRAMAERLAATLSHRDVTYVAASPLDRAAETAAPLAAALGLEVVVDERLVEADNAFEGRRAGVGDGVLRRPQHWWQLRNPFKPSWGEPYAHVATRMLDAIAAARDSARGHEAVLVSHQLPVWTARLALEGRHLWHDPRRRQCSLASLTTLTYEDDAIAAIAYSEPAADLLPRRPAVPAGA